MKRHRKTLIGLVLILGMLLSACLDPSEFDTGWEFPSLSGNFTFTDITNAVLIITNWSRTVSVTDVRIGYDITDYGPLPPNQPPPAGHLSQLVSFPGRPGPLERKAQYLPPSDDNYWIFIEYKYDDNETGWVFLSGPTAITLPLPQRIAHLSIFRDIYGEVKVEVSNETDTDVPGGPPADADPGDTGTPKDDPHASEGSVPAVIPEDRRGSMGTVVIVNMSNSERIHRVHFNMAGRDYNMWGVNYRDRQSIALGNGSWTTTVYHGDNVIHEIGPRNVITVPSNDPQAASEHYLFFYRTRLGGYQVSNSWPPVPNDVHEEDILPPVPPGHRFGRGVIEITNNTNALVTSVNILDRDHNDSKFIGYEDFFPPQPIQNRIGSVIVIGDRKSVV